MELLNPTRITSLEGVSIRVIIHKDRRRTEELTLPTVYPFETVFNVKQRIAIAKSEDKTYLPKYLFVAQEVAGGTYSTIEYFWPFSKTLNDPFTAPGVPDPRIYEDDSRKGDVFPNILSGVTVEAALSFSNAPTASRVIHVWTAAAIANAAGFGAGTLIPDAAFEGFFQLYFPTMKTKADLAGTFAPRDEEDIAAFTIAQNYRRALDARLVKIDAGLRSLSAAAPLRLRELRNLRYLLPKKEEIESSSLELKFYEMNPNPAIPFLRYFAQKDASLPLIKLAVGPTGTPIISNPKLLDMLMADTPDTEKSAVILLKSPIEHPQAPLGTAWSMSIFEDGTASLRIGAPRKDAPLTQAIIQAAFEALPGFLENTLWSEEDPRTLVELTAVYDFKSKLTEKPSRAELRGRLDAFASFFLEEPLPEKSKATLALRYRAVSNFDTTNDPIMSHLTQLYLRDSKASAAEVPAEEYVNSLTRYFGLPQADAARAVQSWINTRLEYILADKETAIAQVNMGTAVGISTNNHPYYTFYIANVESMKHLQRLLSLLCVFSSMPASDLKVTDAPAPRAAAEAIAASAAETPSAEASPESAASSESNEGAPMQFAQQFDFGDEDDADPFAAPVEAPAAAGAGAATPSPNIPPPPPPHLEIAEVDFPEALKAGEKVGKVTLLENLKRIDPGLFEIKGAVGDIYSKKCQKNAFKQPFVLTPENYLRARNIYKDDVFWIEAPLDMKDLQAVTLANKTVEQRKTFGRKPLNYTIDEIKASERRALELGFPLKNDESVLFDGKTPATKEEKAMIQELIAAQKTKQLWTVLRAGSISDHPNYYMCGVLWCVRDELPLIPAEYDLPTLRNGEEKPRKKGCPFCGGTIIENTNNPAPGETVYLRQPSGKGSAKVAQYIGFPKELYHPDGYSVPCCFVDPDDLSLPLGAKPLPPPHPDIPLPDIQIPEAEDSAASNTSEAPAPKAAAAAPPDIPVDENRERPFAPLRARGGAQNAWYIPNQNVVGRISTEWYTLGRGEVGVPPPSVNKIIGQDPDVFLTANKGALGVSINSYLKSPGSAFVRYSIGNTGLLGLLCYAEYASMALSYDEATIQIADPAEMFSKMFDEKEIATAHAFEQANYGTLVHEFANPSREIGDLKFQTWCGKMGITLDPSYGQRPYAEHLYKAWLTFTDYMKDTKQPKDLRLFEGLFAIPGLLTSSGFVLVRIVTPKNPSEKATILCPEFGTSVLQQTSKPPLLFVVQDSVTGAYDPLVLFDSPNKETKRLLGLLQPETPDFGALSPPLREALTSFIAQYYGPFEGCGRITEPVNPWIPELETTLVPRARAFVSRLGDLGLRLEGLLRDRSNRLVGCIVRQKKQAGSPKCFIPLLDDGSVFTWVPSLLGEEALPKPPLKILLDMLMGARYPPAAGKLASDDNFPGLLPVSIGQDGENYISIDLKCGATIPIEPFPVTSAIAHERFAQLQRDGKVTKEYREDFPWDTDITLLGPAPENAPSVETTDEEQLEEAYQHLRISFGHWLHSSPQGMETLRQIELLRRARRRLPLWDLRKRMDVLVTSVVLNSENPWMSTEGNPVKTLLRRDCLKAKRAKRCNGGCTWAGEHARCLIHTPATDRYVNPTRVLAARLVDELIRTFGAAEEVLRQKVPYLRPLPADALIKGENSLLFAAEGRGSASLYDRLGYSGRKPTAYTKGLTYPEEVDMEVEGVDPFLPPIPEDWTHRLRPAVFGADISRDPRARFEAALLSVYKKSYAELTAEMGDVPLDGSPASLEKLAEILGVNFLTTAYNPETRRAELDRWYGIGRLASPAEANYVVLDLAGIPLERVKKPGSFKVAEHRLPSSIRAWLEEHSPE